MKLLILSLFFGITSAFAQTPDAELCAPETEIDKLSENVKDVLAPKESPFRLEFCLALEACTERKSKGKPSCKTALEDYKNSLAWLKSGTCGMTPEELVVMGNYTGGLYACVNEYLWKPSKGKAQFGILVDVLKSGLSKLPQYKGLVTRGAFFPDSVKAAHAKGAVVTYDAFTSTSAGGGPYNERPDQILLYSTTGRPIMSFSTFPAEGEILFLPQAKFKVLEVIKRDWRTYYILKEVTDATPEVQAAEERKIFESVAKAIDPVEAADSFACPFTGEPPKLLEQKNIPKGVGYFRKY